MKRFLMIFDISISFFITFVAAYSILYTNGELPIDFRIYFVAIIIALIRILKRNSYDKR